MTSGWHRDSNPEHNSKNTGGNENVIKPKPGTNEDNRIEPICQTSLLSNSTPSTTSYISLSQTFLAADPF